MEGLESCLRFRLYINFSLKYTVPYVHYYYTLCHYMFMECFGRIGTRPFQNHTLASWYRQKPQELHSSPFQKGEAVEGPLATDTLNNMTSSSGNLPWMCHESLPKDLNLPSICHEFASKSFRPGVGNWVPSNLSNNMQQSSKYFKVHDATDESHGLHFQSLEAIAGT